MRLKKEKVKLLPDIKKKRKRAVSATVNKGMKKKRKKSKRKFIKTKNAVKTLSKMKMTKKINKSLK